MSPATTLAIRSYSYLLPRVVDDHRTTDNLTVRSHHFEMYDRATDVPMPYGIGAGDLDYSVSHSGNVVVLIVTNGGRVGIDVEQARRPGSAGWHDMARDVLTPGEMAELAAPELASSKAEGEFLRLWCRKEAVVKATGEGLLADLSAIDVRGVRARTSDAGTYLSLQDLPLPPNVVGAVASSIDGLIIQPVRAALGRLERCWRSLTWLGSAPHWTVPGIGNSPSWFRRAFMTGIPVCPRHWIYELHQTFFMRVAMGLSIREIDRESRGSRRRTRVIEYQSGGGPTGGEVQFGLSSRCHASGRSAGRCRSAARRHR
jgi:hypothetical protein